MKRTALVFPIFAAAALIPDSADAYSVKVHIHIANEIRAELVRNWDALDCDPTEDAYCGKPAIRLLGPGDETRFVILSEENAQAIRDNPEFWRGGAIGPDNTVFPGMTDPSHAWHFAPFSQCQAMLDATTDSAERAYALGCFLHGITDNNVHHVVNYFTGETFTLFPKDAAQDGELEFSLLNVVRHMTVESKIEAALEEARPDAFTTDKLTHRIATDLYRRVYLSPDEEGRGLWHWFAGGLVQRKNDALRAAQLDGFDPNMHLETSIEDIRESGATIELDGRVMDAYIEFLSTGGSVQVLEPGGLAPYHYVLLLPELVEDVKRLLDIAQAHGEVKLATTLAQWQADGECSLTCPLLRGRKELYEHLFAEQNGGPSRFQQAVDLKKQELDGVTLGYVETVEKLSNLILTKGAAALTAQDISMALAPIETAIDDVSDFPYELLFPSWAVDVIDSVGPLREFLEGSVRLITEQFKEQILARMSEYTTLLKNQLLSLTPQAVEDLHEKARQLRDIAVSQVDQARLDALGLDLSNADAALKNFGTSVLYMNSFNSVAGALANQEVVFSQAPTSFHGGGPVSFDASYQVGYTQLSVCDDLAKVFYPCGTSAIESLQGNFEACEKLDIISPEMEPNVECHDGDAVDWVDDPNPAQCVRREFDEVLGPEEGHLGSYSLAYPPELADRGPECFSPVVPGITAQDGSFDDIGGTQMEDMGDGESGCGCTSGNDSPAAGLLMFAIAGLLRRRRRG
ncbi:MAG: MYXO-CTERM sorting domain-containing protein [Nannocystaceae bacterium]|nr:MYXO-CTERM sorting domain-containing protein [Nannocystaceae bacterium]